MRRILILGAGRSASSLIHYGIEHAREQDWCLTVADRQKELAERLITGGEGVARGIAFDAADATERARIIAEHDLIISMLPASMHIEVVRDCLVARKHVITPSYVPDALWALDQDLKKAGVVVLNEMGLDPGIDHMSAMRIIDGIRAAGGRMEAFESYTGGLVAPESDTNPWGYKFSWNPRNVILAGQGPAAKYIQDGDTKYIPYHALFRRAVRIPVDGFGDFDGYANRDSLKYRSHYGLDGIPTLLRGTLRKAGFCEAWDAFVQLGCTEDGFAMELGPKATWSDYLSAFLPADGRNIRVRTASYLGLEADHPTLDKLDWLGLFSRAPIGMNGLSPAATLQRLLEEKWKLEPHDKDLVLMWHRFRYHLDGQDRTTVASLGVVGTDQVRTAMARTVGLPIAIASKLILNGTLTQRGVILPLRPAIYDPVLDELASLGISFTETTT